MKSIFFALLIIFFLSTTAAAQNLNFVNTKYAGEEQFELLIYAGNGTYLGTLNTSTPLTDIPSDTDLVIYQRQKEVNVVTNPTAWLEWVVTRGAIGLFVFMMIVATVLFAFKQSKKY